MWQKEQKQGPGFSFWSPVSQRAPTATCRMVVFWAQESANTQCRRVVFIAQKSAEIQCRRVVFIAQKSADTQCRRVAFWTQKSADTQCKRVLFIAHTKCRHSVQKGSIYSTERRADTQCRRVSGIYSTEKCRHSVQKGGILRTEKCRHSVQKSGIYSTEKRADTLCRRAVFWTQPKWCACWPAKWTPHCKRDNSLRSNHSKNTVFGSLPQGKEEKSTSLKKRRQFFNWKCNCAILLLPTLCCINISWVLDWSNPWGPQTIKSSQV